MNAFTDPVLRGWTRVVHSCECDEDGNCPVCLEPFEDCPCPGPTQMDEYDYMTRGGVLYARPKKMVPPDSHDGRKPKYEDEDEDRR